MDGYQWRWAETVLRHACQISTREPMITQYEGLLQGQLSQALCGVGLTMMRQRNTRPRQQAENYFMRYEAGVISLRRHLGDNWLSSNYAGSVDIQFGSHGDARIQDFVIRMELKVGSIFPLGNHNSMTNGDNAWHNDIVHLSEPAATPPLIGPQAPRADAFLFVCDEGGYRTLMGQNIRRTPPGRGNVGGGYEEFVGLIPEIDQVIQNAGRATYGGGIYQQTGTRLMSVVRMVNPNISNCPFWYKNPDEADWHGGDEGDPNLHLIAGVIGQPPPEEQPVPLLD